MILKGNIIYMCDKDTMIIRDKHYLIIQNRLVKGVFETVPERYQYEEIIDYGDKLIIPGMSDLHVHAPQYAFRGMGMDMELLEWLNEHAFLEEEKFSDEEYSNKAYKMFAEDLLQSPTTRACIFGTIHKESTYALAKMLDEMEMITHVGKVNMDRNSSISLQENTIESIKDTEWYIRTVIENCKNTKPIITPRFVPSCTDELMIMLAELREKYNLGVQSHLSENPTEVEWVLSLNRGAKHYGDAYDMFGLFGGNHKAIMAHCVYSGEEEMERMKENNVYVAHCPNSNFNLASGMAPIRKYLQKGIKVGLGSDIAGGTSISLFRAMQDAIIASKMNWRYLDSDKKPISSEEAFYMATMGGGSYFGKVGSFLEGYEADVLILNDEKYKCPHSLNSKERLERLIYLAESDVILEKYVRGKSIYKRN